MKNKDYIMTMLNVIDNNIDILIEEADNEGYKKGFIEFLKEMKEDIANIKEVIE